MDDHVAAQREAVAQISGAVARELGLVNEVSVSGLGFSSEAGGPPGRVRWARCFVRDGRAILRVGVAGLGDGALVEAQPVCRALEGLSHGCRLSVEEADGATTLVAELAVRAAPLGLQRTGALEGQLSNLAALARILEPGGRPRDPEGIGLSAESSTLEGAFEGLGGLVRPVRPWTPGEVSGPGADDPEPVRALGRWAERAAEALEGGVSVAMPAGTEIEGDLALATLAAVWAGGSDGAVLGRVHAVVDTPRLLRLAAAAPGPLAVAAAQLTLGTNPYHRGPELRGLLSELARSGAALVFTGDWSECRSALGSGQGAGTDPLRPLLLPPPAPSRRSVVRFRIQQAAADAGGLPASDCAELADRLESALEGTREAEALRCVSALATRLVRRRVRGSRSDSWDPVPFARSLTRARATFGGERRRQRADRAPEVGARYRSVLLDASLERTLTSRLIGQDDAVRALAHRVRSEARTRPEHQPLRWALQGPPGVGKSESCAILADLLDIPLVRFNASAWPDPYTATSQLRGSARGIVGSFEPGRLELAAKAPGGALVEVADLDHADERVRQLLGDLFLDCLEDGETRSGTGEVISTANLILVFTLNLGGDEERVSRSTVFGSPGVAEVRSKTESALKRLFSTAWLSRMGRPVLFRPLDASAYAILCARLFGEAVERGLRSDGWSGIEVEVDAEVGRGLAAALPRSADDLGARALGETARGAAATAIDRFLTSGVPVAAGRARVREPARVRAGWDAATSSAVLSFIPSAPES